MSSKEVSKIWGFLQAIVGIVAIGLLLYTLYLSAQYFSETVSFYQDNIKAKAFYVALFVSIVTVLAQWILAFYKPIARLLKKKEVHNGREKRTGKE